MRRRPWILLTAATLVGVVVTSLAVLLHGADDPAIAPPPPEGSDRQWSGYIVRGVHHQAGATFRIPTIRCDDADANLSVWVGLDGAGSETVEQVGIEALCRHGEPRYGAWTQAYPRPSQPLGWTPQPGDLVTTEARSLGDGTIRLSIKMRGSSSKITYVDVAEPAGRARSAEVIVEQSGRAPGPIPRFGEVTFHDVTIDGASLAVARPNRIVMVDERNRPRAAPGPISDGSFVVIQAP